MSLAAMCWWTMVRSVVLCLLAWPVCLVIERSLKRLSDSLQFQMLVCLLAPVCFPELLVGYSLRDYALARPRWAEALCSVFLLVRMIPVGTIALLAAPRSSLDAAAIHCRWLLNQGRSGSWHQRIELARCYWHGPIMTALPALALMSIVAFQEFEMAALLQTISWTDWFVAAQRLGLEQNEMLRKSLWPILWQLPVLIGVMRWLQTSTGQTDQASDDGAGADRKTLWTGIFCVLLLVILGCLIPIKLIGWRTIEGLSLLLRQHSQQWGLASEIVTSGAVAVCAGMSAWTISGLGKAIAVNGSFLGLFGSLLLSLGCVAVFQQSWFHWLYDTPFPWVLTLTIWLLPRAAILRLWLHALRNDEAAHVAQLVKRPGSQRQLLWRLRDQPRFLAASLLCYWAYCDLPTAYMLAPTGMASGLVRLYNFMHYGRSSALSAEACVFFGAPVVLVSLLFASLRWWRD